MKKTKTKPTPETYSVVLDTGQFIRVQRFGARSASEAHALYLKTPGSHDTVLAVIRGERWEW